MNSTHSCTGPKFSLSSQKHKFMVISTPRSGDFNARRRSLSRCVADRRRKLSWVRFTAVFNVNSAAPQLDVVEDIEIGGWLAVLLSVEWQEVLAESQTAEWHSESICYSIEDSS